MQSIFVACFYIPCIYYVHMWQRITINTLTRGWSSTKAEVVVFQYVRHKKLVLFSFFPAAILSTDRKHCRYKWGGDPEKLCWRKNLKIRLYVFTHRVMPAYSIHTIRDRCKVTAKIMHCSITCCKNRKDQINVYFFLISPVLHFLLVFLCWKLKASILFTSE